MYHGRCLKKYVFELLYLYFLLVNSFYFSNPQSAIAELQWDELFKLHIGFNLKIIPDISESLLLYNDLCKKVVCINNIKQCLENNSKPKCQYLVLTTTIKDCISRFSWLGSNNNFYCENVMLSNIFAIHDCGSFVVLLHFASGKADLFLFECKTKTVRQKLHIVDTECIKHTKIVLRGYNNQPGSSSKRTNDGFLLLNGQCYKFVVNDSVVSLCDHDVFENIVDIFFGDNDEYFLLNEQSHIFYHSHNKLTKIISAITWNSYCLVNDNSFLVSDYKAFYLCKIDKDFKLIYFQLSLQFVTSIVFYKQFGIAICITAQNKLYRIKTDILETDDNTKNAIDLDIDNIDSAVHILKEIQNYSTQLDAVSKDIEKQNTLIKNLGVVLRSNLLTEYFKHDVKIEQLNQFQENKYYLEQTLKIHSDICPLLSTEQWYYKTQYLDRKFDLVHNLYRIPTNKSTIIVSSECDVNCKSYELKSSIQTILVDERHKIGAKVNLTKDFVNTESLLKIEKIDDDTSSHDLYNSIDQMIIYSQLPTDQYCMSTSKKTRLKCMSPITSDLLTKLFPDSIQHFSDEFKLRVNGDIVKFEINRDMNYIEMSCLKMSTLNRLRKYLVIKSQPEGGELFYNPQEKLRLEVRHCCLKNIN